jgi:hypothetical protein
MASGALKRRADCGEKNNECDYENRDGDWQSYLRLTELLCAFSALLRRELAVLARAPRQ